MRISDITAVLLGMSIAAIAIVILLPWVLFAVVKYYDFVNDLLRRK